MTNSRFKMFVSQDFILNIGNKILITIQTENPESYSWNEIYIYDKILFDKREIQVFNLEYLIRLIIQF